MKTLHLLFNHTLTEAQKVDAMKTWGIKMFKPLPDRLQELWSHVPADIDTDEMGSYLYEVYLYLTTTVQEGDVVLIQGDFGATCMMVSLVCKLGAIPVYATTVRRAVETKQGDRVLKTSVFEHVRFREYPVSSVERV